MKFKLYVWDKSLQSLPPGIFAWKIVPDNAPSVISCAFVPSIKKSVSGIKALPADVEITAVAEKPLWAKSKSHTSDLLFCHF